MKRLLFVIAIFWAALLVWHYIDVAGAFERCSSATTLRRLCRSESTHFLKLCHGARQHACVNHAKFKGQ